MDGKRLGSLTVGLLSGSVTGALTVDLGPPRSTEMGAVFLNLLMALSQLGFLRPG